MKTQIAETMKLAGIIPVIALQKAEHAVPLAKALLAGGIRFAEITFRTDAAEESIAKVSREVPEMIVGAGTVLTLDQLNRAVAAGATFIVSPGYDSELVAAANRHNLTILPGAVTPSEIMQGQKQGIEIFKFFPAGNYGGLKTIKALTGPFPNISFVPTGGVSQDNLAEYLSFNKIAAVGGSWMCPANLIAEGNFAEITKRAAESIELFRQVRTN